MKNIFKTVFGGLDKATEIGGQLHIPVIRQIDAIKDSVKDLLSGKKVGAAEVRSVLSAADEAKSAALLAIQTARDLPIGQKGMFESKRALMALANMLAVGLIYYGFPPEMADQVALYVTGPAAAYILGESVRPSVK